MRFMALHSSLLLILAWAAGSAPAGAHPGHDPSQIARYMEASKPGEQHTMLAALAGSWDQSAKIWPAPGREPRTLTGSCENRMILGGRFLQSEAAGESMGTPWETLQIIGYDRRHERFEIVAFDTQGTYSVSATGGYDPETRTISMYGEDDDPIFGYTQKFDMNLRFVSDDEYVFEIVFKDDFHSQGTGDFKMVEVTYTRRK